MALRRLIHLAQWVSGERRQFIRSYRDAIHSSDGVIIGGGQILVDRQLFFPLRIGAIVTMARAAQKPIALFSCGADPRWGWIARRIYRQLVRDAGYISVRDRTSASALFALDKRAPVRVHPDIGFLAAHVYPTTDIPSRNVLGINVMPYETVAAFAEGVKQATRCDYIAFWRRLATSAADRGWLVKLMTNGNHADFQTACEIYSQIQFNGRVELAPRPANPGELVETLSGIDCLIASRMHAGIVAHSLGKRVLPLVWDTKVKAVWDEVDPAIPLFHFDELFGQDAKVADILDNILTPGEARVHDGFIPREQLRHQLDRALDELAKFFKA